MMKAVIFKGPYKVAVEERPIPKIQDPTDIIIKVTYTAVCGRSVLNPSPKISFPCKLSAEWLIVLINVSAGFSSELHVYRVRANLVKDRVLHMGFFF